MRLNSFQVRPSGFTEHFPETGGNHDIPVFPGGFAFAGVRADAVSPRLLDDNDHEKFSSPNIVKSSSVFATPLMR